MTEEGGEKTMFAKALMWLIVILCTFELIVGQTIVEISGGESENTQEETTNKTEPIHVQVEESGRKVQYDIPDDGLLPKWCISEGKTCPVAVIAENETFTMKHELECMHKCRQFSCMSAQFADGTCTLSSTQCTPEQLVSGPGKYYQRLPASETDSDPDCPGGTSPIGIDEEWPTNIYCRGVGVECLGPDLVKFWFRPTARQCLVECNLHPACMSAHYRDKICYLRANRCTQAELIERPGGFDFHRLKKGEECPLERPRYEEENTPYTSKFCMAWGKTCKGYDIYRKPQKIFPFQKCLEKCAKIKSCGSVDFFGNRCAPKEHRCTDEELEQDATVQNFMRLQEGEDCPGNRKPPSQSAPWSNRFCLKRDYECPGNDLDERELVANDFIDCLKKCVSATNCESVQFESDGKCFLKSKICDETERLPRLGVDLYSRLREGDECTEDTSPPECPLHSSYFPEHSTCPATCDNQIPDRCDMVYEPSCICDDGYVRNGTDHCVPVAECGCREHDGTPRDIGASWISSDCEILYSCELDDSSRPVIVEEETACPDEEQCNGSGQCECVDGYERNDEDVCVPVLECGPHSSFQPQGIPCFDTCKEPNLEAECTNTTLTPLCRCNDGYILNEEGGECVPYRDCGCKSDDGTTVIAVDTKWLSSDCMQSFTCAESVDELPEIVPKENSCPLNSHCEALADMPKAACVCDPGWTLHVDGTCVPGIECEPPTEFVAQRSSCPSTCRLPKLSETCTSTSGAGCQCASGMLLDDDEDCLPAETCPCYDENGIPKNVGDVWMTNDCSAYMTCVESGPGQAPEKNSTAHQCQDNAICDLTSGFPQCICEEGYTTTNDGVTCVPVEPPCEDELNDRVNSFVEDVMSIVDGGCGSCSDTCRHPNASKLCPSGSQLCKCFEDNQLFDEALGKCIPANECPCFDANGQSKQAGTIWVNNECTKQLTCEVTGLGPPSIKTELYSCANCDGRGNCLDTK